MDFVKTNSAYFMAIYLFLQLLRFRSIDIKVKLIENLSRRHFINSSDVSEVLGQTACHFS